MAGALQGPAQRMTLRRFVRVTIDNFRQLIQTISMSPSEPAMPPTGLPPARSVSPSGLSEEPLPAYALPNAHAAAPGEARAGNEQVGDERVGDERVGDEQVGDEQVGDERVQGGAVAGEAAEEDEADEAAVGGSGRPGALSLAAALESLLFVSDEAVEPAQLARALGCTPSEIEAGLLHLDAAYRRERRGLRLQVRNGRFQLVTAPEAALLIETYLNLDAGTRLSGPALEALAVVAYRQPVTRAQVEAVRGVDCSGVLRSLLGRGLLEEVGRLDAPGRPVLYGVTDLFMHHFGLTALHDLPPLEDGEIERMGEVGA